MTELLLQPVSVRHLALLLLNLIVLGYLLSTRGKSQATWWLAAVFAGFSLSFSVVIVETALFTTLDVVPITDGLFFFGTGIAVWSLLHFAYRFLENSFAREARIALWGTGLLLALDMGHVAYDILLRDGQGHPEILHDPLLLGFILWATVVLLRKRRRAARDSESEVQRRAARAYRSYALINGLLIAFIASQTLVIFDVLELQGWIRALRMVVFPGFSFGLAVVYINHAPEPTTLQAKLVGLSLVTVMAILVTATEVLYPKNRVEQAYAAPPQREALRFTPDGEGGYEVTTPPYSFEDALGERLALDANPGALQIAGGSSTTIVLGFAFPFYGTQQTEAIVDDDPIVTFGGELGNFRNLATSELPMIVPLLMDLNLGEDGGIYLNRTSDRATITWHEVTLDDAPGGTATLQLALHADGTIDFIYGDIAENRLHARGIAPGGSPPGPGALSRTAALDEALPYTIAPGSAYLEHYDLMYGRRVHETVSDLFWLVFASTLFILVIFPFFFRRSLLMPLERLREGVQRVNAGDLKAEVPVGVRDEIGYVTHHFNRMTRSLRRADQELKAYAEGLEDRVAERTAALSAKNEQLERAMRDLKQVQQQLVQQEKLASLGGLTAGIAHEIKNPLNFITNFSELSLELIEEIRQERQTDPQQPDAVFDEDLSDLRLYAEKIREHGRRADAIIRSMMLHARGTEGQRESTDVNALVEEYVNLAYHGKRAQVPDFNVTLERDYDKAVGEVEMVPQEIGRVLLNLLNNAFDAVHEQAARRNGDYAPAVRVVTRRRAGQVEIRVEDNGPGIPEEVREKIFEPFFTTKPTGQGTGLGLSMSYDIVMQGHGGALEVESEGGRGAAFTVRLPVSQPQVTNEGLRTTGLKS